jgi:hypothetical protein
MRFSKPFSSRFFYFSAVGYDFQRKFMTSNFRSVISSIA